MRIPLPRWPRILGVLAFLSGFGWVWTSCSNPINAYTGMKYFEAARNAESAGDLERARMLYSRAAGNADIGHLDLNTRAHAWYEYARVSASLGEVSAASESYRKVVELIATAKGAADSLRAPALAEYARLLDDSGDNARAVLIYAQALPALEVANVATSDPIAFAVFLERYARCLEQTGNAADAASIQARAVLLRTRHPGEKAKFNHALAYSQAAQAALHRDDWSTADRCWARVLVEADSATLPVSILTTAHYEHGRSQGVLGHFAEAERELLRALELDEQNQGETYMDLTELARLNYDQHKYETAIGYFKRAFPILERTGVAQASPAAMIDLLTEYADCLSRVGRAGDANATRTQ